MGTGPHGQLAAPRWTSSLPVLIFAAGCLHAGECHFKYSRAFAERTVVPILRKEYGNDYSFFNWRSPGIVSRGRRVTLVFDGVKPDQGVLPFDGPVYLISVDASTCHVIDSREAPAYAY